MYDDQPDFEKAMITAAIRKDSRIELYSDYLCEGSRKDTIKFEMVTPDLLHILRKINLISVNERITVVGVYSNRKSDLGNCVVLCDVIFVDKIIFNIDKKISGD
jgi:hypothetical protein